MMYLKMDTQTIGTLVLLVVIIPTVITGCSVYYLKRKSFYKATGITLLCMLGLATGVHFNVTQSTIDANRHFINLNNAFYKRQILTEKITNVEFVNAIPENLIPRIKSNGLGIGKVKIGNFKLKDGKPIFFFSSLPPYNVVKTDDQIFVFSSNEQFNDDLMTILARHKAKL